MKTLFALLLLLSFSFTNAQLKKDQPKLDIPKIDMEQLRRQTDSTRQMADSFMARQLREIESKNLKQSLEQNERNLNAFMADQRERKKKEERSLWIRGGILLLGIGLAVAGYVRRKKKKNSV